MVVGKRTATIGIARMAFEVLGLNNKKMSLLLIMTAIEMKKSDHSRATSNTLPITISSP